MSLVTNEMIPEDQLRVWFCLLLLPRSQTLGAIFHISVSCSVVSDSVTPMDCSPPGSSVCGILQARILDWVAIPFSRRSSWPRDWIRVSYVFCMGRRVLYRLATRKAIVRARGLISCGSQAPEHRLGIFFFLFSCSMPTLSCGVQDLAPRLGIKPGPLPWECRVLATGPPGKSVMWEFNELMHQK